MNLLFHTCPLAHCSSHSSPHYVWKVSSSFLSLGPGTCWSLCLESPSSRSLHNPLFHLNSHVISSERRLWPSHLISHLTSTVLSLVHLSWVKCLHSTRQYLILLINSLIVFNLSSALEYGFHTHLVWFIGEFQPGKPVPRTQKTLNKYLLVEWTYRLMQSGWMFNWIKIIVLIHLYEPSTFILSRQYYAVLLLIRRLVYTLWKVKLLRITCRF